MKLKLPLFVRKALWRAAFKRVKSAAPTYEHSHGRKWLILFDERDAVERETAQLIRAQHAPFPAQLLGYYRSEKEVELVEGRINATHLDHRLLPNETLLKQIAADAFEFVIQLSPEPALPMQYIAALAPATQRIAVNLKENNDLYCLELKWQACDAATASQRFFGQLKTYFKNAI